MVVTGPTVVIPLLRHIHPSKKMGSIAKWEGIIIDPIGAVLAVLVFEFIRNYNQEEPFIGVIVALRYHHNWAGHCLVPPACSCCSRKYWIPDYLHGVVF